VLTVTLDLKLDLALALCHWPTTELAAGFDQKHLMYLLWEERPAGVFQ
jgi:hypothetical protein